MDRIEIEKLKIYAYHGVFDEEREQGQYFYISAKLFLDLRRASMSDDLTETVSYDLVAHTIQKVVTQEKWNLIEAVAESVASELLLTYPGIQSVEIRVDKPDAPVGLSFETVSVTIQRGRHRAYLGIGSNLGDREGYLNRAVEQLKKDPFIRVLNNADYIETEPYGPVEQPKFLNGAVEVETLYTPRELLQVLQDIEKEAGRKRILHWGPRTLDLDILLYDDEVIRENDLMIPHVEMAKRDFVLEPLCTIAPYAIHPLYRKTVQDLLDDLKKQSEKHS
ncbi:MAG: 2-amino-4-hydroxy-6-hydroxymethyldihydropteridine diphosphokinase [Eubacterium sp.]|nr:2-amino-4-hydroxy-6-hydroxymethyldihydropteridine diphosphokinase [Eubacterium sp.]